MQLTGLFSKPSADLHSKVAPQRSIKVPSWRTLVTSWTCETQSLKISVLAFLPNTELNQKVEVKKSWKILTARPFFWAERLSLREYIPPQTETSRHTPGSESPPQKEPWGCIRRIPFVVKPSISRPSCHFVAFSCTQRNNIIFSKIRDKISMTSICLFIEQNSPLEKYFYSNRILQHKSELHLDLLSLQESYMQIAILCSAPLSHHLQFSLQLQYQLPQSQLDFLRTARSAR